MASTEKKDVKQGRPKVLQNHRQSNASSVPEMPISAEEDSMNPFATEVGDYNFDDG